MFCLPKTAWPPTCGRLGSRFDEERSEMRYGNVNCRIPRIIESLNANGIPSKQLAGDGEGGVRHT